MKICVEGYYIYRRDGEWVSPSICKLLFSHKTLLVSYKLKKHSLF